MTAEFFGAVVCRVFAISCGLISNLAALRLYSVYLEPGLYGRVMVATQILSYLPLLDGGFRTVTSRQLLGIAEPEHRAGLIRFSQVFYTWFGVGVVLTALLCMSGYVFFSPSLATMKESSQGEFLALAITTALSLYSSSQVGLLVGLKAQGLAYFSTGLGTCAYLAGLWAAFHSGTGVWAFPIASAAGAATSFVLAFLLVRRREPLVRFLDFDLSKSFWAWFHRLKREALECFRFQITTAVLSSVDIILVALFCKPEDVAVYGILSRLISVLRSFLQSVSEVAWPMVAQLGLQTQKFNMFLLRMNSWIFGSVTGVIAVALLPFCQWYMGEQWTASRSLLYLLLARFVVTGLATPSAYFLYGLGEFSSISRPQQRELIAAVLFSLLLGPRYGEKGIAAAFLIATLLGTGYPMIRAYCARAGLPTGTILVSLWWRVSAGLALTYFCTLWLIDILSRGFQILLAAGLGLAGGLVACLLFALFRSKERFSIPLSRISLYRLLHDI